MLLLVIEAATDLCVVAVQCCVVGSNGDRLVCWQACVEHPAVTFQKDECIGSVFHRAAAAGVESQAPPPVTSHQPTTQGPAPTSTSLRVSFSSSRALRSSGCTITPPFAPPKGTSITAVFQVLSDARLQQLLLQQHTRVWTRGQSRDSSSAHTRRDRYMDTQVCTAPAAAAGTGRLDRALCAIAQPRGSAVLLCPLAA